MRVPAEALSHAFVLHNHGLVPSLPSTPVTCFGSSLSALNLGELDALWHLLSQILTSDVMSQSHEGPLRPNCASFGCKPIAPWSPHSTLCTIDRVEVLLQVPQPHRDAGWSNCALYGRIPLPDRVSFGFRPSSTAPAFCVSIGKVLLHIPPPLWCQIGTSVALGYQPESGAEVILAKEPTFVPWLYVSWAIGIAISIAHSGALSLLLLMLAMLCKPCCPSSMRAGRIFCRYIRALPLRILCAWKFASPGDPAVTWSPPLNRKGRPVRQRANHGSNRPGTNGFFAWILVALALPEPVHAAPFLNPVWFLTPLAAQAMTRQPQPNDPPGQAYPTRRPHLIPPDELTTHVGECPDVVVLDPPDPFEGCDRRVLSCSSPRFRRGAPDEDTVVHEWLGVHLYTPHYQTLQLAVNPEEKTLQSVMQLLVNYDLGPDGRLFDTAVPLRPQRFQGFGSFIRFSSSIRGTGTCRQVAIVLDLTHVGGHYFAAILPHEIAFQTLHDYFWPLTTLDDDPCDVYVGFQDDPILPGSDTQLADGDVITVLKRPGGFFHKYRASAMFEQGAQWASPSNWFRLHPCTSVCVLYGDKRFVVPEHHHYGQNLVAYVSDRLRLNPYSAAMCTFPITDLDVQGNLCHFIVAVSEVPSPEVTGIARTAACDLFVLLDPRPLGQKPCFLFLHHPVVHLPTVEATLGLSTGRNRRLGVRGGIRRGEDIHVEGSTTLLLFAEEIGEEAMDSDSSVPENTPASSSSADVEDIQHQAIQPAVAAQEHPLPGVIEVAQEDPWGQEPPLTMLGLDLFDPTLPQGHSWNANSVVPFSAAMGDPISPAKQNPHGAGDSADNLSRRDDAPITAPVKLQILVYVPDFVPEIVEVEVSLPAAIETLLAKLRLARPPEQASSFSILSPASPQPLRSLAIFVAGPTWQSYTVVILVDCRRYNGCMFARAVPHSLNRESLMQAAGLPADEAVHVYVHGLIQPLALDQRITLLHGMTVSFVPRTENGPASHDLADMLLSNDGWDSIVPIPGPRAHINSHCYLLTDTRHFTMAIQADRRSEFREDVARAAGAAEHRLSICTAKPRVLDAYPFGYWATSVLVATESLSRVPCPPARVPETRLILVLDQRRILRGFDWKLIGNAFVGVQELADSYHNMCPVGHVVSLEGARLEYRGEEQVFVVQHGQILTVEFVPESLDAGSEDPPPESPDLSVPQALPDVATGTQPAPTTAPSTAGHATSPTQPRSRSPRGKTGQNNLQACELHVTIPKLELQIGKVLHDHPYSNSCMWCKGPLTTAFLDGTPSITPAVLLSPLFGAACTLSPQRHLVQCKLLCEPTGDMSADMALDRARHATRLLGDAWPRPPYRWPLDDVSEDVEVLQEATPSEHVTIDIVVYLLTPDYHPEKLDLTVQLPQTVEELVDLVQTCRDQARHCLFPTLVEVIQQPDPGWALFLALPPWPRTRAVVCMDLSFFDGRVFANTVPEQPDFDDLCEAAGLGPVAEVDIFIPGLHEPLQHGIRIDLQTGMTIVFMMQGVARPPPFSLAAMLRTHLPWEHSPVFPSDRLDNGYCVAGPRGQVLFRLHPERACFYVFEVGHVGQ